LRIVKSAAYGIDKAQAVERLCEAFRLGNTTEPMLHMVDPNDFGGLAETPFAYWVPDKVRQILTKLPSLEPTHAEVRVGAQTSDDFRFLRLWFEVPPDRVARTREETFNGRRWVSFAKGGERSPFFSDIPLVIQWERDGAAIRNFYDDNGRTKSRPQGIEYFFRRGLTYPLRAESFNVRAMPDGCAFGHKGPSIFASRPEELPVLLGLLNSALASWMAMLRVPVADADKAGVSPAFEVGSIQIIPVPEALPRAIEKMALELYNLHRSRHRSVETSHEFVRPILASMSAPLVEMFSRWQQDCDDDQKRIDSLQQELDDAAFDLYQVTDTDRAEIRRDLAMTGVSSASPDSAEVGEDGEEDDEGEPNDQPHVTSTIETAAGRLLSWAIGCAFGRWDVRLAQNPSAAVERNDAFSLLPTTSPGMLIDSRGAPAMTAPDGYPIDPALDGILIDDPYQPNDLVTRIDESLTAAFGPDWEARKAELVQLLGCGTSGLRVFLRDDFFKKIHRPMYTLGGSPPRRAPLYLPLYPRLGKRAAPFGVWLYIHRLKPGCLFTVRDLVRDKRQRLLDAISRMSDDLGQPGGRLSKEARDLSDQIPIQRALADALDGFEKRVNHLAEIGYVPDLDDGVMLNAAFLHELMNWQEADDAWARFESGDFDWSNLAAKLRPAEHAAFLKREQSNAETAATKASSRAKKRAATKKGAG
jgi:hypothetical protein